MFDGLLVFGRLVLYVGLMLAFGMPAFVWRVVGANTSPPVVRGALRVASAATVVSLLASVTVLWAMAAAMVDSGGPGAVWSAVRTLLTQTIVGMTWDLRVLLLLVSSWLGVAAGFKERTRVIALSLLGAVALVTLAWGGHGAMSDGPAGWLHLGADMAHLLVAGAWVGALATLTLIARSASRHAGRETVALLSNAATGFASMGTLIVAVLIISGVINYIFILGPTLTGFTGSLYDRLLLVKLGLFAIMLSLAAANRFRLAPALERARRDEDTVGAVSALKRSVYLETALVVSILALVAWLGTLDPAG
jgi:putative copper resistance protein D